MTNNGATTKSGLPIVLWIVPAILLVVAILPLPYGYYTFTRVVVCLACIVLAYSAYEPSGAPMVWAVAFVLIAILFNPIIPIHLKKQTWAYLDVGAAVIILFHMLSVRGLR